MAKLLFFRVHGSADPTMQPCRSSWPTALNKPAMRLRSCWQMKPSSLDCPVAENLVPFGWPPFKEILAETLAAKIPIHV